MAANVSHRSSVTPGGLIHRSSAAYQVMTHTMTSRGRRTSSVATIKPNKQVKAGSKATLWQKILFWRRIATFGAGATYTLLAIQITVQMVLLSSGIEKLVHTYTLDDSLNMRQWIGATTIRQSPLVRQALGGHAEPINQTLYLHEPDHSSFQPCLGLSIRQQEIYSDSWLRYLYSAVVTGTAYNLTFLNHSDLIVPVVDCMAASVVANDTARSKFHFLIRDQADSNNISMLTLAMAVQEYWIHNETQVSSAAVTSVTSISDLQSSHVDHSFIMSLGYPYFELDFRAFQFLSTDERNMQNFRSIPRNPTQELSKLVQTSHRSGFYYKGATEHFNFKQQSWLLDSDPIDIIARWRWQTKSFIRNTWTWVHIFDSVFGLFIFGHFLQLNLVFYRTMQEGKLWAGDGTVPTAKPFLARGVVVVVFWYFTGFWEVTEFCLQDAHQITQLDTIYSFTELMRFDMFHIVGSWAGFFGKATRERIDGGILFFLVALSFIFRAYIIQISPALIATIKDLAIETAQQELRSSALSPMQLRAPYAIEKYPTRLILYVLLPTLTPVPLAVLFVIIRKIYWHYYPKWIPVRRSQTPTKATETKEFMALHKSAFTNFELATGARLEDMYGLLSDYDNYVIIKGMKFASADGIYAAGFLIVNKKFLVQANDIWDILLMKLVGVRYKNLYIFRLSGTTVQQTALLVYPHTITMADLLHLGVSTLS